MSMNSLVLSALALFVVAVAGCGTSPNQAVAPATPSAQDTAGKHDGWWCNEHGVPEEICGQCNSKAAADFKAKGDWCKEHDRPDSQCFVCHPELEATFAAQYEAKYGKKPPKPESEPQS